MHSAKAITALFDEPNLVSCAGLVPVMRLAQDCDLAVLVAEHLKVAGPVGANAGLKVAAIVAGMIAGADSIDDLDVLCHGGMAELFGGVRAPSTLGSFLRGFDWGAVRQLEVVSRRLLVGLAGATPVLGDARGWPRIWTSTRHSGGSTGTPSRARGSGRPRSVGTRCGYAGSTR
ncbi:MAG: hypothetical protein H0V92_09255 [Pseudonocardiales bacterium]|nr:hypothetical protein [Pseudonocardiales bacterium]